MPDRKQYLLRIPTDLWDELNLWARDELRSVNAQIEYVLRQALRKQRKSQTDSESGSSPAPSDSGNI